MNTWLLLRGLTREARHWGDFPRLLQTALPEARVEAIDLPGAGNLNVVASPSRIEDIADQCRAQVLALGLQPPFNIVAMSLGAMVAVAWADSHPDEVAACVLINTSLRKLSPFHRRLRPASYPTLLRVAATDSARRREVAVFRLTSTRSADERAIVSDWIKYRRTRPVSTSNAFRQLIAAARYRGPQRPPAARLLIMASARDALVNPECSRQLARAWQADYVEHPGAGHDLPLDDGTWVADQIARWRQDTSLLPSTP